MSIVSACSRDVPHIAIDGGKLPHTAGRVGAPNEQLRATVLDHLNAPRRLQQQQS
ncbi:hypothetical protein PD5205_03376 [Xanthomonas fragariae]|uniref:Uncharacterized protein n=1 Tax=Xanthomonas fragariae TaxID=48664 RepID=A0A1Y6HS39_9XANT|nr:hypothetical protein [Xanthomonas fragariae]MBL9222318.1 hypothetical protein [Xanthomonas fragariae]SMQ93772.1 hypothetical protein NBC2815_00408 [Xanthomonas fragariae]SMQ97883.1 hypothetical protein PD885_00615 [Xanthomonas fragariae]SMR04652.1 hypothetical protein PD5205_03376 [Xanthomonas fragariae]